jgi:formylglycine-generating enzyme
MSEAVKRSRLIGCAVAALASAGAGSIACRSTSEGPPQKDVAPGAEKPPITAGSSSVASGASPLDASPPPRPMASDAAVDAAVGKEPTTLAEQRAGLLAALRGELRVPDQALERVRTIFEGSPFLGQGNPKVTVHPMSRAQCREIRSRAKRAPAEPSVCGAPNMVPIHAAAETARAARVCVDQYEFPNVPCEYPVVHVSGREAALLCEALGKRLCDAHEWEGACAGSLRDLERDYTWKHSRGTRALYHNRDREIVWAYGATKNHALCATASRKSRSCTEGGYAACGSNTYPAGAFPECVSSAGVYDQHGNAAEHMNIALEPSELTSRGGHGYTEMKGSSFFFSANEAHEDDCRWRAPSWHATKVMDVNSHSNYHLGFRCCKSVGAGTL